MENIIYINNIKLVEIISKRTGNVYILDDGSELSKKDFKQITFTCLSCTKQFNLKQLVADRIRTPYKCQSCRVSGENNPMFGKVVSEETRKKQSERHKGKKQRGNYEIWVEKFGEDVANEKLSNFKKKQSERMSGSGNHMYGINVYDLWVERYGEDVALQMQSEKNKSLSTKMVGENNPMFGKTPYDIWVAKFGCEEANIKLEKWKGKIQTWANNNKEHYINMAVKSNSTGYRKTSIEKKVEEYLISNNIQYKYNFILNSKYQYDFIVYDNIDTPLIIEVQGDYWHANPNIYSSTECDKKPLHPQQLYKVKLDETKKQYLIDNNYSRILYIWETEIKNGEYVNIINNEINRN